MATAKTPQLLEIEPLKQGRITLRLIGMTGLYFNSMSVKAKRNLFLGGGKKTAAEKKVLKHNPEEEFRASVYRLPDGPTLLGFPAPGVKAAMATAALETAGVTKTSVNRLIYMPEERIKVWGRPYLKMDVVRNADQNRTADIRTRAFLPRWCTEIDIAYVEPTLSVFSVVSLLTNAGVIAGIGDFRQEKGKGSFGCFRVIGDQDNDEVWAELQEEGRALQQLAMNHPAPMDEDEDTAELMEILQAERTRRAPSPRVVEDEDHP